MSLNIRLFYAVMSFIYILTLNIIHNIIQAPTAHMFTFWSRQIWLLRNLGNSRTTPDGLASITII